MNDEIDLSKINPDRIILATTNEADFRRQLKEMEVGEMRYVMSPDDVEKWNREIANPSAKQ